MKTKSNVSCRPEIAHRAHSHLFHAALLAVTLFGSACGGGDSPKTVVAKDAGTSQTGGAGGRPAASDAGTASDAQPDGPTSSKLPVGAVCIGRADCATGNCVDGVCCESPCDGTCLSCSLTGKVGTCAPVLNATDDTCDGTSACNSSGACREGIGQTCNASPDCASGSCVDGVCCGTASCGTCQSCGLPGSQGSCAPVPKLAEDTGCSGAKACDGLGGCRTKIGQYCSADADCASQHCADKVCCDTACTGTCYSCNDPDKRGTCSPLLYLEDASAATPCAGSAYCDVDQVGAPFCMAKLADGEACTFPYECLTNVCRLYFRDADGDGYGVGAESVAVCGQQPPQGTAPFDGDCCDSDTDTFPGVQTFFFSRNRCSSYDYNCDGVEQKQTASTGACGSGPKIVVPGTTPDRVLCR